MIRLHDIQLRIGSGTKSPPVLSGITFAVPQGGFRWLLGPSGAGKSSLLRVLQLAARPSHGQLELFGTPVHPRRRRQHARLRSRMGVVHQDYRLLPELSVFDNVALPMRLAGLDEARIHADVDEMLGWLGLGRKQTEHPAQLSGGEQQRVAIARAVVLRPAMLLADEPTGALDAAQATRLMEFLIELNQLGSTVIVATHNEVLVQRFPAASITLARGRLRGDEAQA